ncbi:hypothetical protein ALC60_02212 [Trachymyrmex zeteki]|uniref:Uncharacterized protein n=1 Tax=Mycetomoellerius zeteki TaxID=64791 RepID=A0A151XDY1_9HYME|nr:hypothetical protein ALC60_02212 [Trachymyrmex zeteki]
MEKPGSRTELARGFARTGLHALYLLGGDERRDVRGDRRRVYLTMTTGEMKKLAGSPSTTSGVPSAVRSARCSSSARERNEYLVRSRSDRPAASDGYAGCSGLLSTHARVPVVSCKV